MIARALRRLVVPTAVALAAAVVQLTLFVHDRPPSGSWFLYGTDTVSHDVPVQWWAWRAMHESWARGGELPLWLPQLQGGLPTLGAFLWTPAAPSLWLHAILPFPWAQWAQFVFALAWGGLGAWVLARRMRLPLEGALMLAVGWGLSGHVVTLIHAGHLQKVLALAWLPWGAAGVATILASTAPADRWQGSALAGAALGMMLLAGHPQIAALLIGLLLASAVHCLATTAGCWRCPWGALVALVPVPAVLGFLLGGLQLLPGLETSVLSNRAGGVAWDEAVATSYPPLELVEWFLPRAFGDSSAAGWNSYTGHWGQRLVSDYAGIGVVALAILGVAVSERREKWLWASFGVASLVVGLGRYTPVYGLLYDWAPGFRSFRSPATFFAGTALALPVLAAMGAEHLFGQLNRHFARGTRLAVDCAGLVLSSTAVLCLINPALPVVSAVGHVLLFCGLSLAVVGLMPQARIGLSLALAIDLMSANSAFLRAVPWIDYAAYAEPDARDLVMIGEPPPRRLWEPGRELSLRPLFVERDALLGYHPISYGVFAEHLHATGAGSAAWRTHWGVAWEVRAEGLWRDDAIPSPIRSHPPAALRRAEWLDRRPNALTLDVRLEEPATLELAETLAPGWQWRVGGGEWSYATGVALTRHVNLPAGSSRIEWRYRPASYRLGLWASALGVALLAAMLAPKRKRR